MATESSLILTGFWDWAESSGSNKTSRNMQVYKNVRPGTTQDNVSVVVNKNKVRGRGRALQLQFTSEQGKDAEILGWGILVSKNAGPSGG